jgi:phospholipase C
MFRTSRGLLCVLAIGSVMVTGCKGPSTLPLGQQTQAQHDASRPSGVRHKSATSPIQHIVLIVQENRSFNNLFATFPGADGTTTGHIEMEPSCGIYSNKTIPLTESPLVLRTDLNHSFKGYNISRDNGSMDGFDRVVNGGKGLECTAPYQYVDPYDIEPYWELASQYTLAEHMFTTEGSDSFIAHQDLIRGGTMVETGEALVNTPTCSVAQGCWWGCDAPLGTGTSLISENNRTKGGKGPFPCSNDFALSYPTLRDLLDGAYLSWKYYTPASSDPDGRLLTAFDAIYPVRYGSEWGTNVNWPETNIFYDISDGSLPAVSWVIPTRDDSDHPGVKVDDGPSWVASVVNAIGESSYWNSTAIIIVWDDWGGLYDNLSPQQLGYGGLGFRVPAIIVSPYAKPGYISQTDYEFGSIIKYIEQNWNLGSLGTTDQRAKSIIDSFDYSQNPIPFSTIPSLRTKSYFLHRKGPFLPPDTDM